MKRCIYDIETPKYLNQVQNRYESLGFICGGIIDYDRDLTVVNTNPKKMLELLDTYDMIIGFNNKEFDNLVLAGLCSEYIDVNSILDQPCNFGKYATINWIKLPMDYLEWMANPTTDHSYQKIAKTIIAIRNKEINVNDTLDYTNLLLKLNNKSVDLFEILKEETKFKFPTSLNEACKLTLGKEKLDGLSNVDIPVLFKTDPQKVYDYQIEDCNLTKELYQFIEKYGYCLINLGKKGENYQDICIKVNLPMIQSKLQSKL